MPEAGAHVRPALPLWLALAAALCIACGPAEPPPLGVLEDPSAEFSPIRFHDRGLVSLNDRCPVTGTALNPAIEPVYVNGRPIGFC